MIPEAQKQQMAEAVAKIRETMAAAAKAAGRDPAEVRLCAACKTRTVEEVRAAAGMDIGGTLIGMHLRRVAVPVRLSMDHIGQAILLCARTRPPFIGGSRAVYTQEEVR